MTCRGWVLAGVLALVLRPASLWACATCFGASDSPLAKGMNMGILALLGVVCFVLASIAVFFVYLARRAASMAGGLPEGHHLSEHTNHKV